jgi:two-component system sensor kinase FixL
MSGSDVEQGLTPRRTQPELPSLAALWLRSVPTWPRLFRIGLVATLAVGALAARVALADRLGERPVEALFYPTLAAAVLLLGPWSGVAVFALAVFANHAPLTGAPLAPLSSLPDYLNLAVFAVNSALVLVLARALAALSRERCAVDALDGINAEQLGHFVEQAPASMAMFDRDMRYLAASARWRDDFHLNRDIVGKSHYDLLPEIGDQWKDIHARALAGETVRCDSDRFERPDGELVWLRWEVRPWRYPHDGIGGVLIFCEDVTERIAIRRALEDNERRLNAILDSALEAIVTIGNDGRIVSANPAACDLFGYAHADLLGKPVDVLMPHPPPGEHARCLETYNRNRESRVIGRRREVDARRGDGSVFPLEIAVSEAQDNGGTIFVGFMRDLSPIHDEKRRVNALRDELAHVSRINDMGEVVASLAHEVGQPVAAILNFAAAYRRAPAGPDAEGDILARIEAQARRAGDILKRLRGFIEKRPETREMADVAELIEEALQLSPPRSRARVLFEPEPGFEARVDRIQIEQVIVNLLQNADEAAGQEPFPQIRIALARPGPERVCVSVADNGPGVQTEAQDQLFSAFYSTKRFGMGVGLSICKSIVEAHGGEIRFRPNAPRGAVFEFTLPAADQTKDGTV